MSPTMAQRVSELEQAQREQQQRLETVEHWQDVVQATGNTPSGSPALTRVPAAAQPDIGLRPAMAAPPAAAPPGGGGAPLCSRGDEDAGHDAGHDGDQDADQDGDQDDDRDGAETTPGDESDPSSWSALEPDQRSQLWWELAGWVDWLAATYDLHSESRMVAPCWWRHSIAVQELAALRTAWLAAHEEMVLGQHTSDPAYWHDRLLWPLVHRLRGLHVFGQCTLLTHVEPTTSGYEQQVKGTREDPAFLAVVDSVHAVSDTRASSLAAGAGPAVASGAAPAVEMATTSIAAAPTPTTSAAGEAPAKMPAEIPVKTVPVAEEQVSAGPGVLLDEAQVAALCAAGQAERLLPDLASPVLVNGHWWVVLEEDPAAGESAASHLGEGLEQASGLDRARLRWGLVEDERVSHTLEQMMAHQRSAQKAVQALPTPDEQTGTSAPDRPNGAAEPASGQGDDVR